MREWVSIVFNDDLWVKYLILISNAAAFLRFDILSLGHYPPTSGVPVASVHAVPLYQTG